MYLLKIGCEKLLVTYGLNLLIAGWDTIQNAYLISKSSFHVNSDWIPRLIALTEILGGISSTGFQLKMWWKDLILTHALKMKETGLVNTKWFHIQNSKFKAFYSNSNVFQIASQRQIGFCIQVKIG